MKVSAVYPGTFDPFTHGHEDIVRRAARLFDRLVVAVASNPRKVPSFDVTERVELAQAVLEDLNNVEVVGYEGLTVEFARARRLEVIVRGLRAVSDFEFEFQLANMGRHLQPDIETMFMVPTERFTFSWVNRRPSFQASLISCWTLRDANAHPDPVKHRGDGKHLVAIVAGVADEDRERGRQCLRRHGDACLVLRHWRSHSTAPTRGSVSKTTLFETTG